MQLCTCCVYGCTVHRLNICVREARVATEGSVVHENFPEFPQCIFPSLHRFWTAFKLCPRSSRCPFHFVFPAPPFTPKVSAIEFDRYFFYDFRKDFQKHTFLSHRPWRHPGICHQSKSLGRSRFQYSKDSRCTNEEVGTVCFNQDWNKNTSSKQQCCIPLTFCCLSHTSESSSSPTL